MYRPRPVLSDPKTLAQLSHEPLPLLGFYDDCNAFPAPPNTTISFRNHPPGDLLHREYLLLFLEVPRPVAVVDRDPYRIDAIGRSDSASTHGLCHDLPCSAGCNESSATHSVPGTPPFPSPPSKLQTALTLASEPYMYSLPWGTMAATRTTPPELRTQCHPPCLSRSLLPNRPPVVALKNGPSGSPSSLCDWGFE